MLVHSQSLQDAKRHRSDELVTLTKSLFGFTLSNDSLGAFFDNMSVYLRADRTVAETLFREASTGSDPELRRICADIAPQIRDGGSLCMCLRAYERRFPPMVLAVLEVGEASRGMADAAQRLADAFHQIQSLQRKYRFLVYDPRLLLLLICLIDFVYLVLSAFSRPHPETYIAIAAPFIAAKVAVMGVILTGTYLVLRALVWNLYRWNALKFLVDSAILALPQLGPASRDLCSARWARSFAVLLDAGVNVSKALEVSSRSALNARYEGALRKAAQQTRKGATLLQTLTESGLLSAPLMSLLANCDTKGKLHKEFLSLTTEMETDALARSIQVMNKIIVGAEILAVLLCLAGDVLRV